MCAQWPEDSDVYKDGITQTMDEQRQNLEASYSKIATPIQFIDPFGESPDSGGVYFTLLNQIIPSYSAKQKGYVLFEIELTEATQVVA
jgi:hypothetical protein